MKKYLLPLAVIAGISCQQHDAPIYSGNNYQLYSNRVQQNGYTAMAHSGSHLTSDYQSPANQEFPNFIEFKFAINGKDNEMPMGINHTFLLQPDTEGKISLPTLTFGQKHTSEENSQPNASLQANTPLTIQVNAQHIIRDFEAKGYYEAFDGSKWFKEEFTGFYIAGNLSPLGWDFDNLNGRTDRQLTDPDGDGIYSITLMMNPYNPDDYTAKEWTLTNDISVYPQLSSDHVLIDALYNMSLDETVMNIEADGTFRTGKEWPGVWTRDVSYSILLAYAYLAPEVAKTSLMRKVKNGRIVQDTGTGGAWPISSDRTTWALAAWELFAVTGDTTWLNTIYPIIKQSAEDDLLTLKDQTNNLLKGESSFLDWRKQTYPLWMNGVDIFESRCLGTNAVHYQTYMLLGEMADILGDDGNRYRNEALLIKKDINQLLWDDQNGFYSQYLYGRHHLIASPRSEALGAAFTVLFQIADQNRAEAVIQNTPTVDYGVPCIHPQIPGIPPYHNNGIWPFVQAYWNWAAAKADNTEALEQGLAAMYRSAALFLTNKENMVAENGDFRDTEVNSDRQLWSIAGNIAMVYRVFLGMDFHVDGIRFSPIVPSSYGNSIKITNFSYRNMVLDIEVKGSGNTIKHITLDGKPLQDAFIPGNLNDSHKLFIELNNMDKTSSKAIVPNAFSLPTPRATIEGNELKWSPVEGASGYELLRNGLVVDTTSLLSYQLSASDNYQTFAVRATGQLASSFISEPLMHIVKTAIQHIEAETITHTKSPLSAKGYTGKGYVEINTDLNTALTWEVKAAEKGSYLIQLRYSNGSGPDNTNNKCAIRTLKVNGQRKGVLVMPQRGKDEWSNWGFTNLVEVELKQGSNTIQMTFEKENTNMDGSENRAFIDALKVIPLNK